MHYVGLDQHWNRSSLEILNPDGKCVKRLEVRGRWPLLLERIEKDVPRPFAICYEASCGYGYLHDRLSGVAQRVVVAHPGQLRLIFRSKKKNDRVDASKLAKLLYLDEVPAVHVPGVNVRAWRGLIEFRQRLVSRRAGVKNQIRALLRGVGIAQSGASLWTRKGMAWLEAQPLDPMQAVQRMMLIDELVELSRKIKQLEKQLNRFGARHAGVRLLRTIPGVGPRTAEAICAYIDDATRFASTRRAGSYFGLVPCQDSSAGKERLGHITRQGPATVRKLLCEAAWVGIRKSPSLRAVFQRIAGKDPDRRKIALVAVARHLCGVMAAMLKSGEVWREQDQPVQEQSCGECPGMGVERCAPLRKTPDT